MVRFVCEWQVKLCAPLVTHGPYRSTLEKYIIKRYIHSPSLLYFTYHVHSFQLKKRKTSIEFMTSLIVNKTELHREPKCTLYFCNNSVKLRSILIISGTFWIMSLQRNSRPNIIALAQIFRSGILHYRVRCNMFTTSAQHLSLKFTSEFSSPKWPIMFRVGCKALLTQLSG